MPVPTVGAEARRALAAHPWPGNVRELQGEIRRAVVLAGGAAIRREHLSAALRVVRAARRRGRCATRSRAFEREHVTRELARDTAATASRTAVALGITRQALAAKMARLGL